MPRRLGLLYVDGHVRPYHGTAHTPRTNPEAQRPAMRGFKIAQAGLSHRITALEAKCRRLKARLAALPKRVPVAAVLEKRRS